MRYGETSSDPWRRKKVAQMFFTSSVLMPLNNYFESRKAKEGNCCNQLSVAFPQQKPNWANKARTGSQQQLEEVFAPGSASGLPEGVLKAAGVWRHQKQCPGPLWQWLALGSDKGMYFFIIC